MIEILESPDYLLAMKLAGNLSSEDVALAYKETEERLKKNERISFFAEIDDSMGFTVEAVWRDIKEGIGHLGKLSKYYRAAIVTEKGWLGAVARLEGMVFSGIDVRVFSPEDRNKAFAWASEKPEPIPVPEQPEPSIHFIQTSSASVFAYEINGRLREKDIKAAVAEMKPFLEREGKFNVIARLKGFGGFDLLSLFDDDLIRMKYKALSKVEKYAVVGATAGMRNFIELLAPLFSVQIKIFDANEEDAAWEWVGARQALLASGD